MTARCFLAFVLFFLPISAFAEPSKSGTEWLEAIDRANSPFQDAQLEVRVEVQKGNTQVERTLEIWQRGSTERRVRMSAPARLAGVSLLVVEDGSLYSYLPAYRRTRKVVGEQRGDAFMGTDFSFDDLSRTGFADEFTAQVENTDGPLITLILRAIEPNKHRYPTLRLRVEGDSHLPRSIEHLDPSGSVQRRVQLNDVREVAGHPFAHQIQLDDLERSRQCTATIESIQVNQNLPDRLFQVGQLGR